MGIGTCVTIGWSCIGIWGRVGLGEEFLEGGQCFSLEFYEFIQLFGFKDDIGGDMGKWVCSFDIVGDAETSSLHNEFERVGFGKLFDNEWMKFDEGLVTLGFNFPFVDGWVKGARAFDGCFEKG